MLWGLPWFWGVTVIHGFTLKSLLLTEYFYFWFSKNKQIIIIIKQQTIKERYYPESSASWKTHNRRRVDVLMEITRKTDYLIDPDYKRNIK